MAMQKAKSGLMAKYGAKLDNAVKKHAADPTDYGSARIPPGITNGVAKLTECTFGQVAKGKQNEGEFYFRAVGVVVEPKTVNVGGREVPVEGLQTSIMEMVCDTKTQANKVTTQEEHIENILNEMRKLGAETEGASGSDLEELAAALKEAAPYFRFSTSQGKPTPQYPDPRVWENWYGVKGLEDYSPPDATEGAVEDESEPAEKPSKSASKKPLKKEFNEFKEEEEETAEEETTEEETEDEPEENPDDYESLTIDELLEKAADDDELAQAELTKRAIDTGTPEGQVTKAKTWKAVAEFARKGEEEAEEETEEEEEPVAEEEEETPWEPSKDEIYMFKPVDPKTKKKAAKGVECEVTAVDKKAKTVTLKNLDNPKLTYAKVKWDDLESAE